MRISPLAIGACAAVASAARPAKLNGLSANATVPADLLARVSAEIQRGRSGQEAKDIVARDLDAVEFEGGEELARRAATGFWLEAIKHQGRAAFNPNAGYKVFRNVKDYGAKGDGKTDDTAAIQLAISDGGRCAPNACASTTITPAVVYFPSGTYIISTSIVDYYYTQLIGNPNGLPVLKATPNIQGFGVIDGDQYGANGLGFGSTNVFWRQVRNFVIDLTAVPPATAGTGIHWPTAQATSLQNIVFRMSDAPDTAHQGIFVESGSGGFMADLTFYGGLNAAVFGNQQFTMRNFNFYNAKTAISQLWDWGWTYKNINIRNCTVGLDISAPNRTAQTVGSITWLDGSFTDVAVAFNTSHDLTSQPPTAGSLIIENTVLRNVPVAVRGPANSTVLPGTAGTTVINGFGQGHFYTPSGPNNVQAPFAPKARPLVLLAGGGKFYERSKPQYQAEPLASFLSTSTLGCKGDGVADDTAKLQAAINSAAQARKILFVDAGTYRVTRTVVVPAGSRIVGESYPVIMSSGSFFASLQKPAPVVQVGLPYQSGAVEWSDMIVSTQGAQAGAILVQWNLASPAGSPSGMWDVHTRIGGFAGSKLQLANCPTTPSVTVTSSNINKNCYGAFMSIHLTRTSKSVYLENTWFWTADHDVEDPQLRQITVYTGRGMLVESAGPVWLVGTAVEHHALYEYQFVGASNVFAGQIQTETAYWGPNPPAYVPFPVNAAYSDPDFRQFCAGVRGVCAQGWGLRAVRSSDILVYGAGLYSFFNNYSVSCSNQGNGETCQTQILSVRDCRDVVVENLNTVGTTNMLTIDGANRAPYGQNLDGFVDTIAYFKTN